LLRLLKPTPYLLSIKKQQIGGQVK